MNSANQNKQCNPDGPVMIIGSGLAGWTIAKEFRKIDSSTPLVMVTAESGDFYAKPALSNAFAQKKDALQLVTTSAEKMVGTVGVTLLQNTVVTNIDATTQEVETSKGRFGYRQLILATGARAIKLEIQGDAAQEVLSVNSLLDYSELRNKLSPGARVLIIGAGLIGCEFANDLVQGGFNVQLVDPSTGPLSALLPAPASTQLRDALTGIGVYWHLGTSVKSVDRAANNSLQVTFHNNLTSLVDVVISAVGLRADCTIAQTAGAYCERGVVVDAQLQTSVKNVYALGDNTQYAAQSAGGVSRTLPYVMPIMNAAKALAQTLIGNPTKVEFPVMPVVIKTPALPIVVASPSPGITGEWRSAGEGIWNYFDSQESVKGFLLMGSQTSQRSEQMKRLLTPS